MPCKPRRRRRGRAPRLRADNAELVPGTRGLLTHARYMVAGAFPSQAAHANTPGEARGGRWGGSASRWLGRSLIHVPGLPLASSVSLGAGVCCTRRGRLQRLQPGLGPGSRGSGAASRDARAGTRLEPLRRRPRRDRRALSAGETWLGPAPDLGLLLYRLALTAVICERTETEKVPRKYCPSQ